jgi:hypothetical protein
MGPQRIPRYALNFQHLLWAFPDALQRDGHGHDAAHVQHCSIHECILERDADKLRHIAAYREFAPS